MTQFTTASLLGIGVGLVVSKAFNIASLYTIVPLFTGFTILNLASSYYATKIVDEYYFNRQRFYILYKEYMRNMKILDVKETNDRELFYLPASLNHHKELFCTFGEYSIAGILNSLKLMV